jgi:hypothetical protein
MEYNPLFSYHIFYFPFKWERKGLEKDKFSKRFDLCNIQPSCDSSWENLPFPRTDEYSTELYNEKNFFYKFVHNVLYDSGKSNNIIRHYERKEAYQTDLGYEIKVIANNRENIYRLLLKSIVLNLYSTGTGILVFYLENHQYENINDILRINQYGRRVFPPFLDIKSGVLGAKQAELADSIAITGLNGPAYRYFDDFIGYTSLSKTWESCRFIGSLIEDLSPELEIKPVIDDRMHVVSWIGNKELSEKVKDESILSVENDDWYRFLFVDGGGCTCQNEKMKKEIIDKHTYLRWQKYGSLYGISRYSMVFLSGGDGSKEDVFLRIFRTMYTRMVELSLIQRASILKFSDEVTHLSGLKEIKSAELANKISDFYKEYIRFVNQIYFREITAQEQGIEMYDMIREKMKIDDQVKDLDNEIGELHNYAVLLEDKERNNSLSILSIIGALFIVPSFIVGFFGMNPTVAATQHLSVISWIFIVLGIVIAPAMVILYFRCYGKKKRYWFLIVAAFFVLTALINPFIFK